MYDIRKLKSGEKISVILFDRNIGDYLYGTAAGTVLSTETYLKDHHLATYTQKEDNGITGSLYLHSVDIEYPDWVWEINVNKYNPNLYWSSLRSCSCGEHKVPEYLRTFSEDHDSIPETKVGWRGPSILLGNVQDMPQTFTHYDTCTDDYAIVRTRDLSTVETTNSLTRKLKL